MQREIDWNDYPNFSEDEFKCSYSGECGMSKEFLDILQKIRTEYGRPLYITSGYRSTDHPVEINKPKQGEHNMGTACDIAVSGADALELVSIALRSNITRVGVSQKGLNRFLHLGIGGGSLPSPAIWSY